MSIANTGRPRKWKSQQTGIRMPVDDREFYEAQATRYGLTLSSYLIWRLAQAHGRPIPSALEEELRAGRRAKEQLDLQAAS